MEAVAEHELSVVLSSHLVSDLERVCDYLVVLVDSRVRSPATSTRCWPPTTGSPARAATPPPCPADQQVISASHTDRQTTLAGPHRRPDPRPRLDRQPAQPGGPRPGLHGQAAPTPATTTDPPWRYSDDLADLAPVPRPGRMMAAALAVLAVILALTGPGLADDYATGIAACTAQGGGCSDFARPVLPGPPVRRTHRCHRRRADPARPDRALLGRAAGRPRARGRHPPAGVEPERHPHPLAGRQARPHRPGRHDRRRDCSASR